MVVLANIDHSDFCPGFKVSNDIISELPQSDSTVIIARVMASWLNI